MKKDINYKIVKHLGMKLKYCNLSKKEISKTKNEIKKYLSVCHKLCCCKNKSHGHKLWSRNMNSANCILYVGQKRILNVKESDLGNFSRPK